MGRLQDDPRADVDGGGDGGVVALVGIAGIAKEVDTRGYCEDTTPEAQGLDSRIQNAVYVSPC